MTTPSQPADGKHQPWEDALDSDAKMTSVVADDALAGHCWAGGLGWRRYDETTGAWPAVPEEDVAETVRQFMLGMRAFCLKQEADMVAAAKPSSANYWHDLAEGWRKAATASRIGAITRLARGATMVDPAEFDTHADLLNAPNCVINLRTGALLKHSPAFRFTQVAGAAYPLTIDNDGNYIATGAQHEDITKALEAIPKDVRDYAQLRYGQAITGYKPPDDGIDVQHGSGANGKSTVLAAILNALGDYAQVLPTRLLFIRPESHSTELMTLRGCRFGIIEELPEEHQLSVAALKVATAEKITARLLYKNNVTFYNICSLVISTNYRLQIRETDHGTWRRLEGSIPYPYTFRKPHERIRDDNDRLGDPTLRERVKSDKGERASAMLAWLVAGAMRFYVGERAEDGDGWVREPMTMGEPPERIRKDVDEWRESCDLLYSFMTENLVWEPESHVMASELADGLNEWIEGRGHRKLSAETFAARWEAHSEVRDHNLEKTRLRRGQEPGLSRAPGYEHADVPKQYKAWSGVRFRRPEDDDVSAGGAGCAGPSVTSRVRAFPREVSGSPAHPAQTILNGPPEPDWERLYEMGDPMAG